jgi:hypothetical protein
MKIAYLFEKQYPVYDLTFQVLAALPVEHREALSTMFSSGFWGLNEWAAGLGYRRLDQIEGLLARIIHNQEGSLTRVVSNESVALLARGDIYAVILHSIGRSSAIQLHERLAPTEHYRGFVQVLPHLASHRQLFGHCPPSIRVEKKALYVWCFRDADEQGEDGEESQLADEVVEWGKSEYPLLGLKMQKKFVGLKHSVFDLHSQGEFMVQQTVEEMVEVWTEIAEHVIYKLGDFAPDVVEELTSALRRLIAPTLTAAECGQVAISLRRSLELLANVLFAGNPERLAEAQSMPGPQQEKYKQLVWWYLDAHFPNNFILGKDIEFELKNLDILLNKGVHEHWIMDMIRPLAIRTILVMNSLLFPVKAGVVQLRLGDDLFESD